MASKEIIYKGKGYQISYEMLNLSNEHAIVFLHGWGASKEIMKKAFGKFLTGFKHIYIDMPGFGASNMHEPLYTKDYAEIMRLFLQEINITPTLIIGHSFGGKVATLLKPANLALLSSAGIVTKKPFFVRFKIAIFKILKALGFGFLYKFFATKDVKGMSKQMYETLKNVVNEDFTSEFKDYKGRAFIFWGEDDSATPLKSGEQIHRLIANSDFHPLKGDHFFFLLHANYINGVINSELNLKPNEELK
ncbi:alpha/beta fold hydrolase [Campylobacter sp. RM16187]|uniref:alpha/beta fold hydrolase n=1 Tax=Campylobacter sp. RM16187 TaxID=1660063 RepID=UPI0021B52D19|nr:alpha/beta hydrolase [Campylobacter sp. RM16187]QKG29319.1 alpha/beta hydrolase family protein [Campylobacter sp. RM16187]